MDIVIISIRAKKFEEITVIFQPISPRNPIIRSPENKQFTSGRIIQRSCLKSIVRTITKKRNTPKPKTIRSLLMKPIISSTIIGSPPRNKEPSDLKLLMVSLTFFSKRWRFERCCLCTRSKSLLTVFSCIFSLSLSFEFLSFWRKSFRCFNNFE